MGFRFSRKDTTIEDGVRRIAGELLAHALADLDAAQAKGPDTTTVHELRKTTKKLRALIRLVRPGFDDFRAENRALRDTAARFSSLRDAEVRLQVLTGLPALPGSGTETLRAHLLAEVERLRAPEVIGASVAGVRESLVTLGGRAREWRIRGREFDALEPGLTATWRAAREGLARVRRDPGNFEAAEFHEWRKAVKQHGFQARLMEPVWPPMMSPWIAVAEGLGEALGMVNDLEILRDGVPAALLSPDVMAALDASITGRRQALTARALLDGRRLLADRPGALAARWGRWWRLWRD